jgi:1,3-beta-glucanosyltransferase GAS1
MFSKVLAIAGLLAGLAINAAANAVPTIEAVGAKFFYSNGTQYFIKGMAVPLLHDHS